MIPFELEPSWQKALEEELKKPYLLELKTFVERERALGNSIYPPSELVFNAFWKTPFDKVRVVIVGQDPYHGPGQAHGLCFSVPVGVLSPPSLKNIFKELESDIGSSPKSGCLNGWAEQGILLLNATLTVRQASPLSHHGKGWEQFTDAVIRRLSSLEKPIAFILWGKSAQEKYRHAVDPRGTARHLILKAAHPSPLSAHQGFFGCRHFSQINAFLTKIGNDPINW